MSTVNGFQIGSETLKYNYESLENYNTPEFSTTKTYAVGDYVIYQGKLYKCTTAVTTAGSWSGSNWALAVLSDDVSSLNNAFNNYVPDTILSITSGTVVTFNGNGRDINKITAQIEPQQSGSGTPSPDNIRNITGISGADIIVSPTTNGADGTTYEVEFPSSAGTVYGATMVINSDGTGTLKVDRGFWSGKISDGTVKTTRDGYTQYQFYPTIGGVTTAGVTTNKISNIAPYLYADSFTSSHWYNSQYGAVQLFVPSTVSTDTTVQFVMSLTSPQTYELTAPQVHTLLGQNYVWTNTNSDITVEYPVDTIVVMDKIENIENISDGLITLELSEKPGYISAIGEIEGQTANNEAYTGSVDVTNGQEISIDLNYNSVKQMWLAYAIYDVYGTFISRTVIVNNASRSSYSGKVVISNENARTIIFTYRRFDGHTFVAKTNTTISALSGINRLGSWNTVDKYLVNTNIKSINHRGFNSVAPENTLPAFKLSKEKGFEYVETDVNFTSDGVAVLLHDLTINRTARNPDGSTISDTISINSITYEQALTYDFGIWKGPQYAGTKIPTFEAFLLLCKYIGLKAYVELKDDVIYSQAQIEGLVDVARNCGMKDSVTWISFNSTYLGYVKNHEETARLGYLADNIGAATISLVQSLKTESNEVFINDAVGYVTTEAVNLCATNKIPLEVWTVDHFVTLYGLNPYISGITSNWYVCSYELFLHNII